MGRAIDMENDIGALKIKVEKLENQVRGMVSKLDELNEKSSKTKHVDLVEDVDLGTCVTGVAKDEDKEEKTNDEGDGKSSGKSNKRKSASKAKPNKDTGSSK